MLEEIEGVGEGEEEEEEAAAEGDVHEREREAVLSLSVCVYRWRRSEKRPNQTQQGISCISLPMSLWKCAAVKIDAFCLIIPPTTHSNC